MPERLSNIRPKVRDWEFGGIANRHVSQRPHLAALAMECISSWSNADNAMRLGLFALLFGGSGSLAAKVFLAMDSTRAKSLAVVTAVEAVLAGEPEMIKLLKAVQAIAATNEKQRDKLAHHIWGVSKDLPDALLLADPRKEYGGENLDDIYVYFERDFLSIISANERLFGYAIDFRRILDTKKDAAKRKELFQALSLMPEIRARLDAVTRKLLGDEDAT